MTIKCFIGRCQRVGSAPSFQLRLRKRVRQMVGHWSLVRCRIRVFIILPTIILPTIILPTIILPTIFLPNIIPSVGGLRRGRETGTERSRILAGVICARGDL